MTYNKEKNIAYIKANIPKDRLEQFKEEIRADERRKFAEWLVKNMFNGCDKFWKGNTPHNNPMHIEDFITEYEKGVNNGKQTDRSNKALEC